MSPDITWWQVIATSAVASAVVNIIANVALKQWDHWREDSREGEKRHVVYLDIALQLEEFSFRAEKILESISEGIAKYRTEHDARSLEALEDIHFKFDESIEWDRVPAEIAVRAKTFPRTFQRSQGFIIAAWRYWADLDDAWEYDAERVAFYGLGAISFAAEIRRKIGVADDPQVAELTKVFERHIDSRRTIFKTSRSEDCVIPELREKFIKEGLSVLPPATDGGNP
ncbi:hypothetical protein J2T07_000596 [Luteibacter jiangsuensis]|uniref:Uncharacterized protein n=1 Tax=Luteibacter jiangsuensis TaxID=637577 RepID=A0ABT9SWT4_9GAMM|nr:hypothetical protein [Luteibacter jiangsuensis]MDQ0008437.1 hypothetical protein [Luteibacter jiangsuensis]